MIKYLVKISLSFCNSNYMSIVVVLLSLSVIVILPSILRPLPLQLSGDVVVGSGVGAGEDVELVPGSGVLSGGLGCVTGVVVVLNREQSRVSSNISSY